MEVMWSLVLVFLLGFVTFGECTTTLSTAKESDNVNASINILCTTTGEGFDGWYRNNKVLPDIRKGETEPAEGHFSLTDGDRHTLKLRKIQASDGGDYVCRGKTTRKTFQLGINAAFVPPILRKQYLMLFKDAVIRVEVVGSPKPKIIWKDKDGKDINYAISKYQLLSDGSLRIGDVRRADSGKYTCHLEQGIRTVDVTIEVTASSPPVILQYPYPDKRFITKGYNTTFLAKADGEPKPTTQWYNPSGEKVSTFNKRYNVVGDILHIYDVQSNDIGVWTFVATAGGESVNATSKIVDVYEAPEIYDPAFPWVFFPELFKHYTISCRARGKPTPTVIIRKDGRLHPRLDLSTPGVASVRFFLVRQHDLGNYSCEAWSAARNSTGGVIVVNQTFAMFTKDKPAINPHGSPDLIYSYVGNPKPLMINCDFVSWPKANVTIWRGFWELTNGTDQATLYVWTYSWEDFGAYSCIGSNIYGEVNYTVRIMHATPPSKPTKIHIIAGCDRVNFTWEPPSKNGGMLIDRYVITDQNGKKINTNDSYPEFKIFGLSRNKEYTINIRGMNRMGAGEAARVVFRTKSICNPARPIVYAPVALDLDRTFLDLRWYRPKNVLKEEELYYTIVVKEEEDIEETGHIKVYTSVALVQRVGGLRKNISYRFELVAINEKNQVSDPTYTNYFVAANAWDSAHALTASLWCLLAGLVFAVVNIER